MALLNYSTQIEASKSIAEIQTILQVHGARAILTEFDDAGFITSVSFKMNLNGKEIGFRLPTDWRPVLEIMRQQKKTLTGSRRRYNVPMAEIDKRNQEQAIRVAWCITKDWVKAQMAIIETKMVSFPQVFLPYIVTGSGKTVFEKILSGDDDGVKLLN